MMKIKNISSLIVVVLIIACGYYGCGCLVVAPDNIESLLKIENGEDISEGMIFSDTAAKTDINSPQEDTQTEPPSTEKTNNRPLVGLLLLLTDDGMQQFVGSSYVKYLESAGARVVPIFLGQPKEYYRKLASHVNGILLPGGSNSLIDSDYARAADAILEYAIESNENGTHYPIWGTCLGFQKMLHHYERNTDWLSYCNVENVALRLDIAPDMHKNSRMFGAPDPGASERIQKIVTTNAVAANYHKWCLNITAFTGHANISENFRLVTTSRISPIGTQIFVSSVEHMRHPFYGVAWHPEKNQFEFVVTGRKGNISHTAEAVLVGQYFANFFVQETRKNLNRFANKRDEAHHLIYNYNHMKTYTGKRENASFEEEYRFPVQFSGCAEMSVGARYSWIVSSIISLAVLFSLR